MKFTPLNDKHIALGAKMVEFAGYNMPVSYAGITEEHHTVRKNVGVFDVSHMGEFIVRGKQALDLVQKVTSNDASKLAIGQAQYSCLPNEDGGIVDDLLVYRLSEEMAAEGEQAFMLVVNASNMEKDWAWISKHNHFDTRMINISDETGLLAVQGPNAGKALQSLTDIPLDSIEYYHFTKGRFAGIDNVLISATGYTGAGGFELYAEVKHIPALWDAIFEAGKPLGIKPIGLGARDTLRLEMGFCLYGNDINDTTSPLEAGLGWITKLKKGTFVGSNWIGKQKEEGVSRKLVGFVVNDRRVPRHDYPIEDAEGNVIGVVTSGTQSPSLEKPIGMGYVTMPFSKPDSRIMVVAGNKRLEAIVVPLPIYKVE
ncbi:MAG: glycine cleavage system aminomethyltransferase GcvT [Saprospirales bacterium]|nr:glycine cleavage system aminomethyltransferase GcvT [Saprospirales bacterium]MBK8493092.1 glycine cleavage system aminomethyltransferase GcvT [Saprospirales bacterium]